MAADLNDYGVIPRRTRCVRRLATKWYFVRNIEAVACTVTVQLLYNQTSQYMRKNEVLEEPYRTTGHQILQNI